jgi:hypothetical protein
LLKRSELLLAVPQINRLGAGFFEAGLKTSWAWFAVSGDWKALSVTYENQGISAQKRSKTPRFWEEKRGFCGVLFIK